MLQKDSIDLVIPVYNEDQCLDELMRRLLAFKKSHSSLELNFIFINDGSKDLSLQILNNFALQYPFVKVISLSRNFGHQKAITAGIDFSTGDYVAIIDADLQDPPEMIIDMYQKAKTGFDVVYGKRVSREGESFLKKLTAKYFYRLLSELCDTDIPKDTGDFRLISRKVADQLKLMRESHRFIRGMVPWLGFKSFALPYDRDKRYSGVTKYPFKKMFL